MWREVAGGGVMGARGTGAFRLVTGVRFDVAVPDAARIDPHAVGHALALENRYGGHVPYPYSVAEHSVRVARLVPAGLRRAALLHDAHEGLGLGDVIGPVKRLLPAAWKALEAGIDDAVCDRFGLPRGALKHREIKRADLVMLRAEQRYLRGFGPHLGEGSEALDAEAAQLVGAFIPWSWAEARERWLRALADTGVTGIDPKWSPARVV